MNENGNVTIIDGVKTLKDILPPDGMPVYALFVGKFPIRESVEAGHYYQGKMGQEFWNMLKQYGIIEDKVGYILHQEYEDDDFPRYGFGLTDVVKRPGVSGQKRNPDYVAKGYDRLKRLIKERDVKIVVFLYKEVLKEILCVKDFWVEGDTIERGFDKSNYKMFFNKAEVFVFPGMGRQRNKSEEQCFMRQLKDRIDELNKKESGCNV